MSGGSWLNIRFWPLAVASTDVPLSSVKRTLGKRRRMSANNPKWTSVTPLLLQVNLLGFQRTSVVLDLRRMASAPARFHQSYCWLGSRVAAHGAHATAGDADDRIHDCRCAVAQPANRGFSCRPEGNRLCRRSECESRAPLC